MKASIHLFYGIIIGVLATLCMGSIKTDKAEFKVEKLERLGKLTYASGNLSTLKKGGWTIIDIEMDDGNYFAHVGK